MVTDGDSYWELYDLKNDPNELNNIYDDPDHADVVKDLKQQLKQLKVEYDDTDKQFPEMEGLL